MNSFDLNEKILQLEKIIELQNKNIEFNEKLLLFFIQNSPIYTYIKEVSQNESRVLFASDNYIDMIGIKSSDMVGRNMFDLFPAEFAQKMTNDDWNVVSNQVNLKLYEDFQNRNYISYKFPLNIDDKKFLAGYTVEITEHIQNELIIKNNNLELQKLNADKDRFISLLTHDLKSPFNALIGFSDFLIEDFHNLDIQQIESQLQILNKTIHQTYQLLEQVLMWARSQSGKLSIEYQEFSFSNITNGLLKTFEKQLQEKSINVCLLDSRELSLNADLNIFKTIMRNLISNAIKFTNKNGQIKIEVEQEATNVIVIVSDNGIGIEPEKIDTLWDFTKHFSNEGTNKEQGSGFGLMLCKELIEKHGGKIWVESQFGVGSSFRFSLPLVKI